MRHIGKPAEGEFAPYTVMYISLLPDDGLVLRHLRENLGATMALVRSLPEEKLTWRYAPEKWTIKEILQHVSDDERIYASRPLSSARNDRPHPPGSKQDDSPPSPGATRRTAEELLEELATVRAA